MKRLDTIVTIAATSALMFSILAVALVALLAYQQGQEIRKIQCGQKATYQSEIAQSRAFLKLTPAERIKQYGSIGDVPDVQIKNGITREKKQLAPFAHLDCPGGGAI